MHRTLHVRPVTHYVTIRALISMQMHVFVEAGYTPGDVSENPVTYEERKKGWRMRCDVGEATEGLESEL